MMTLPRMDKTQLFWYSQGIFGPCELAGLFELSTCVCRLAEKATHTRKIQNGECRKEERRKKYNSTKKKLAGMREK